MDADARAAVDRLLSESEITRLVHEYCHGVDKRDAGRFMSVWSSDAVWQVGPDEVFRGDDAILAAATGSHVPQALLDQLAPGGRIVMPIGNPDDIQHLVKVVRLADGSLQQSDLGPVRFVPLVGEQGWSDARH